MFAKKPKALEKSLPEDAQKLAYNFRPPDALRAYVEARVRDGYKKTTVLVSLLEMAMGAVVELGADYFEIERRAKVEGVSAGAMVARLAREGMRHKK